ncbi:tetratricopeptide repeat domain-containing protein [Hirsutella rhossiliensis]|uniref:Tetratricopeptide repeat domain-containing protein n=1 Tax=Hirsutella rhossiliensis TaxID=111463 RepID=A0A9P8MXD0_9HYPO|nr:tetratricopeptide repeat domain-containing protein [Hirsutella rhossiliensis]KAH0962995.1 tetratricopeptide repeat domain-containing protein [Hirsutella rhossiliensis]
MEEFPRESFHQIVSQDPEVFHRLSADGYYDCAQMISEAVRQGASPWAISFGRGKEIPADVLHDLGCIMRHNPGTRGAVWSMVMWASASELGYVPSTISLARNLIMSDLYLAIAQMGKAEARFRQLVARGKDPNALMVEGQWLFKQGRFEAAVAMLQRALKAGSSGFEWKWTCLLWLGRAFLKLGRTEKATEVFEPLAEFGYVDANVELAKLLRTTDPDRAQQHMYIAGCRGSTEMFTFLSEMALEAALATQATDTRSSKESRRWAVEWSRLANWRADY